MIDNQARRVVRTLSLGGGANPYSIAFRPDGRAAYAVLTGPKAVAVLDTSDPAHPKLLKSIALLGSQAPRNLAFFFSFDRQLAFISDSESGRVQVIDAVNHQLIGELDTGGRCAIGVRVSNFGRWLYVADRCLSTAYAIEVETIGSARPAITPIPLSPRSGAWYIAFSPDDRFAYVSLTEPRENVSSGQVAIIDTEQKRQVGAISVGGFPAGLWTMVKTPNPEDPESWQYVLIIFNPGASVQQQPLDSSSGQPSGQRTTTRTGLNKDLTGQPSPDGRLTRAPETPPPCEYRLTEAKGLVEMRRPGQTGPRSWQRVNASQTLPHGARVTTGYKASARIEVWCGGKHVATYVLSSSTDITLNEALIERGRPSFEMKLRMGETMCIMSEPKMILKGFFMVEPEIKGKFTVSSGFSNISVPFRGGPGPPIEGSLALRVAPSRWNIVKVKSSRIQRKGEIKISKRWILSRWLSIPSSLGAFPVRA